MSEMISITITRKQHDFLLDKGSLAFWFLMQKSTSKSKWSIAGVTYYVPNLEVNKKVLDETQVFLNRMGV